MKLLSYISSRYALFTFLLALLSVPLFYLLVKHIMYNNLDESLTYQKYWVAQTMNRDTSINFTSYNNSVIIKPTALKTGSDSFYSKKVYIPEDDERVKHRILHTIINVHGRNYELEIQKSMLEDDDLFASVFTIQLFVIMLLFTGLFYMNRWFSKKMLQPFQDTLLKLTHYRIDKHEVPGFARTNITEFRSLNEALRQLLQRNVSLYKAQKEFTENASHEMQTPLAVIQSKLDLLLQTPVNHEQAGLVEELTTAVRKLQRLNRSLLLLTKIENKQFPETELIALKEVIGNQLDQFSDMAQEKNIRLEPGTMDALTIRGNGSLIDILIGNLFSNALRHSVRDGAVYISLKGNIFSIANTASAGALNPAYIFDRFNKQSANAKSMGLGLEICKQITALYGYKLNYDFADNKHCFSVTFH
ncbi:MAG: HAMP domain-containing histidine kinase [Niabella sp.]|nr:HAMP domain-containing histidine kinase [Niabella sp.]